MPYLKKIYCILIILLLWLPQILIGGQDWHTIKSTHFIVYYKKAKEDFLMRLIENAERYYDKIADDLGFRRYDFWLWDKRAKIYIHDGIKEYQAATSQPTWSSGSAVAKEKIIHSYPEAKEFFTTILPHEMAHIIFREFVGFDNNAVPLWLDEGVACYQESYRLPSAKHRVKEALAKNKFINLEGLSAFNPTTTLDKELVELFYAEATTLINFLLKEFGKDRFVFFCQELRDKRSFEQAVASAFHFKNIKELDKTWQRYLQE